jgi:hypothetical protein
MKLYAHFNFAEKVKGELLKSLEMGGKESILGTVVK